MKTCLTHCCCAGLLALLAAPAALAQSVGIGTATPAAGAALEIQATDRGLLIPRLTAAQRAAISSPPQGLMVYQTDVPEGFWYYGGAGPLATWVFINPNPAGDNLGNHTATQDLNLQTNALTGSGASIGTAVGLGLRADGGLNIGQNAPGHALLLGYQAGNAPAGNANQLVGYQAGKVLTSDENHYDGYQTGLRNTTGRQNLFVGLQAGYSNTGGTTGSNQNHFIGYQAGFNSNQATFPNHFEGFLAGYGNTTGGANTYVGYASGYTSTTTGFNVALGVQAGYSNTGSSNTFVGALADAAVGATLSNATALGSGAVVSQSNSLVLGGTGANAVRVGIGTSAPQATLDVNGTVQLTGTPGAVGLRFADNSVQYTAATGSFTLPYTGTASAVSPAFDVTNTGAGAALSGTTTAAAGVAVRGDNTHPSSTTGIGVRGAAVRGIGVYGEATGSGGYGVFGQASGSGGSGVAGTATDRYGVYARSNSGSGLYAESASGLGVEAYSSFNSAISAATSTNAATLAAVVGTNTNAGANAVGLLGTAQNGYGVLGQATGSGYGLTGLATSGRGLSAGATSGTAVYASSGSGVAVQASTTNASGSAGAVVAQNLDPGGTATAVLANTLSGYGVRGIATASGGWGLSGEATNGRGVNGQSSSGPGLYGTSGSGAGVAASSSTGNALTATSGAAAAVLAVSSVTGTSAGTVVGSNTAPGTQAVGVLGLTPNGIGVLGRATATSVSGGTGVQGEAPMFAGIGVLGAASGGNSYGGYFSVANGTNSTALNAIGLGTGNQAGRFEGNVLVTNGNVTVNGGGGGNGNLAVSGTLSKGGGSFKIDHPLDPENQYLYHSFVESPEMLNIYTGTVALDATGAAIVVLPAWFEALNRDFSYQLTAIGAPGPNLYVAAPVRGNRFGIAGGAPGGQVSWLLTGTRHDAWANENRIPVAAPKEPQNRGRYLHPSAFGLPESRRIGRTDGPATTAATH